MTDIRPFRGIRYNPEKVDIDDVAAPPYDIISLAQQKQYYQKSAHSVVRLDFGQVLPQDTDQDNRYTRAAADLSDWRKQGILQKDPEPALYIYRQTFTRDDASTQVTGVVCLVKLTEFGEDILPHEKTLSGPKEDRRRLLEACEANFSQVFALYSDGSGTVTEILADATSGPAGQETTDEDGVVHEIWPLTSVEAIGKISEALADERVLIADGHHRYETSLNFMKDMKAAGKGRESFDFIMMFLVDMAHEDLIILPTHRLVAVNDFNLELLLREMNKIFDVRETAWKPRNAQEIGADESKVRFGLYAEKRFFSVSADREVLASTVTTDNSDAWKCLDTTLLQETLLEPFLNVSSGDRSLSFTQDADAAIARVDAGEVDMAVLLEPMRIEQVEAVAKIGDTMPQKSTYFYPKPRTGLVLRDLE